MAIQPDDITVATPVAETNVKDEKDVMSITAPADFLEDTKTASTETKVENKAPLDESPEVDEPSRNDVKIESNEEWTDEDQKHLSDRAQKRIRDLNEKAKKADELEAELSQLRSNSQKERFTGTYDNAIKQPLFTPKNQEQIDDSSMEAEPSFNTTGLPWDTTPEQEYEEKVLSPEEYQRDVMSSADILVQARIAQYEKSNEIKSDLAQMERKYPELNPDSPEYSENVSKRLATLFDTQLRTNPNARLSTFVDSIMTLREDKAKESEQKAKASLSARTLEQKSEEALTPHEIEAEPEKPFETLSIEEKEAYLKKVGQWN